MASLLTDYLMRRRNELVSRYVRGDVLDIGCGLQTIISMLSADQPYVGVDVNVGLIECLRCQFPG